MRNHVEDLKAYRRTRSTSSPRQVALGRELAWTFVAEQAVADMALKGKIDFASRAHRHR